MKKNLYRWPLVLGAAAVICGIIGFVLWHQARSMDVRHAQYAEAVETFKESVALYRAGDVVKAKALAQRLSVTLDAHKDEKEWQALRPYQQVAEGLSAYGEAESLLRRYIAITSENSKEKLPDTKDILKAYAKFEQSLRAVAGKEPFASPEMAWRMENDIATSIAWQIAVKLALEDAKPETIEPLYAASVEGYKRARALAEKAGVAPGDKVRNPVNFVSQNQDFMARLKESDQDQQQQQQPQQGFGNLANPGRKPGEKFPIKLPMTSIGENRIEGGKK